MRTRLWSAPITDAISSTSSTRARSDSSMGSAPPSCARKFIQNCNMTIHKIHVTLPILCGKTAASAPMRTSNLTTLARS